MLMQRAASLPDFGVAAARWFFNFSGIKQYFGSEMSAILHRFRQDAGLLVQFGIGYV